MPGPPRFTSPQLAGRVEQGVLAGRREIKRKSETAERGFESTTWQPHFAMLPSRTFLVLPSSFFFFFPESVEIG